MNDLRDKTVKDSLDLALSLLNRKLNEYDRDGVGTKEVWNLTQIAKCLPMLLKAQKDSDEIDPLSELSEKELLDKAKAAIANYER